MTLTSPRRSLSLSSIRAATLVVPLALVACAAEPAEDDAIGTVEGAQTTCTCGGDATDRLAETLMDLRDQFKSKTAEEQAKVCDIGVSNPAHAISDSWDIENLAFAECRESTEVATCGQDACAGSVSVDGGCYFAGAVNYLLWGAGYRLCSEYVDSGRYTLDGSKRLMVAYRKAVWGGKGIADRTGWIEAGWNAMATAKTQAAATLPSFTAPSADALFGGTATGAVPTCGQAMNPWKYGPEAAHVLATPVVGAGKSQLSWHFGGPDLQLSTKYGMAFQSKANCESAEKAKPVFQNGGR